APLGGRFFQLRLERPLVAARGDRVVVRRIAPPDTLGGGTVLEAAARKHGPTRDGLARLERLARGEPAELAGDGRETRRGDDDRAAPAAPPLSDRALALERRLREAWLAPPVDSELGEAAAELPALR